VQLFLPGATTNSQAQCLRDQEFKLAYDGSFTLVLSKIADRPKWAVNWIEVPATASRCIFCLRAYCPNVGEAFLTPDVWFGQRGEAFRTAASEEEALATAGPAEVLGDRTRVYGMWPAQNGTGAPQRRLAQVAAVNAVLLFLFDPACSPIPNILGHWNPLPNVTTTLPIAALLGVLMYKAAFAAVRLKYQNLNGSKGLIPNVSVAVPDPKGDLKGHPCHLYYTLPYDARTVDVKIEGYLRGGFTYTSVHCYGWSSLIPDNGEFRYDETLCPESEGSDRFVLYITTKPTYKGGVNEIDVSQEPTGLCLIRLIYPDSKDEIERCKPKMHALAKGKRD